MTDAVVGGSLLWLVLFGSYAILGWITRVAPAVVTRLPELQEQSARWLKRLPLIAIASWVVLLVLNFVVPLDLCRLCEPGVRFPWSGGGGGGH
ncbi:MAG TPA: hypothetical protein VIL95_08065 [Bacillota bacterium]